MEKAEELVSCGERMLRGHHYLPLDCVAPKCEELQRLSVTLADKLQRRSEFLAKCRELQEIIDKVSHAPQETYFKINFLTNKNKRYVYSQEHSVFQLYILFNI